jgi:ABC-type multidrug transport system fused ATPase/permease subunit
MLGGYVLYLHKFSLAVEIGTISALYLYLSRLIEVYFTFSYSYEEMFQRKARVQNAETIEAAFEQNNLLSRTVAPEWTKLTVSNLFFRYGDDNGKEAHDLNDITLTFTKGERVALIGESGSGKTTFLKVLHGMYPTARGAVSFDGTAAQATSFADLDLKSTLVPQEPEVFSASIEENVTLGIDYSHEEIQHAIAMAEFASVVERLPKGLASVINEKGVNLSGGQKQRLALARALLFAGEKKVILLDESTSSVDSETETKIYQHLFEYFEGRTILASIHKLNLLKYFDRVIMFEKGKLVDQGTFDELLERNDAFKANWERYVAAHKHDTKDL